MPDLPKRTLRELMALYQMEPSIADIFVEGPFDRDMMGDIIEELVGRNVEIYPISSVDVNEAVDDNVRQYIQLGNKGQVIVLCYALGLNGVPPHQFAGIVDADADRLVDAHCDINGIFYTDYCCMEMYAFTSTNFQKFLRIIASEQDVNRIESIRQSLAKILVRAFCIRTAKYVLYGTGRKVPLPGFISFSDGELRFDEMNFIMANLSVSGPYASEVNLRQKMAFLSSRVGNDLRHAMDGHDLGHLLSMILKKFYNHHIDGQHTARHLFGFLDATELAGCDLVRELTERLKVMPQLKVSDQTVNELKTRYRTSFTNNMLTQHNIK